MSVDLSSLGKLSAILPPDLTTSAGKNVPDAIRIKQVSKAMETLFASQFMAELGKDVSGSDDTDSANGMYSDFIQQAMTKGVTSGKGFGMAKQIEQYLTLREHPQPAPYMHAPLKNAKSAE